MYKLRSIGQVLISHPSLWAHVRDYIVQRLAIRGINPSYENGWIIFDAAWRVVGFALHNVVLHPEEFQFTIEIVHMEGTDDAIRVIIETIDNDLLGGKIREFRFYTDDADFPMLEKIKQYRGFIANYVDRDTLQVRFLPLGTHERTEQKLQSV